MVNIPFVTKRKKEKEAQEALKERFKGKKSFNTPLTKYGFMPSYFNIGNRWGTIVDIVNVSGMNHDREFSWFVDVLPHIDLEGVKGILFEKDVVTDEQVEQRLIEQDLDKLKKSIENNNMQRFSSQHEKRTVMNNIADIERVKNDVAQRGRIVDGDLFLLVYGDDPDRISQQLTRLQMFYDTHINGLVLTSVGGEQEKRFIEMFDIPKPSRYGYTWTTQDFALNDHMIRKGLSDRTGWQIGKLAVSYTSGVAIMDIDQSFKHIKGQRGKNGKIAIASSKNSAVTNFDMFTGISSSSLWGQLIANQAMTADDPSRTFHVVLNGFDYYKSLAKDEKKYLVPSDSFLEVAQYFDIGQEGGLNPLESFGDVDNASTLYNSKLDDLTHIFYLLAGRKFDESTRNKLLKVLQQFYTQNGYWHKDYAEVGQGYKNRFMNLSDHKGIKTLGDFTQTIANSMIQLSNGQVTDTQRDSFELIQDTIENALNRYPTLFNSYTTLPNRLNDNYLQYYFDLSYIKTNNTVQEAMFLNVMPYILANVKKNDIVMFHGLDQVSVETYSKLSKIIEIAENKEVRFAFLMDSIGSNKIEADKNENTSNFVRMIDLFNGESLFYKGLETDFDVTILGTMNNDELKYYEYAVSSKGELPTYVKEVLNSASATHDKTKFQVRRPADLTSNVIRAEFVV